MNIQDALQKEINYLKDEYIKLTESADRNNIPHLGRVNRMVIKRQFESYQRILNSIETAK